MIRLILLAIPSALIFFGFAIPFVIEGKLGIITAGILILSGSATLWYIENKSKRSLNKDTALNKILKAEGENLIERK